jgi:hypothetical protein
MADDGREFLGRALVTAERIPPRAKTNYRPPYNSARGQVAFWEGKPPAVPFPVISARPPLRFFSPEERRTLEAVCERILPQDARDDGHKIPICHIDERLCAAGEGECAADMPPDPQAYRQGIEGIDTVAKQMFGRPFVELGNLAQDRVLKALHDGTAPARAGIWKRMPAPRFFLMVLRDMVEAYGAHPQAWDELGLEGPSYPRGEMRIEHSEPETWEVEEARHAWEPSQARAPVSCASAARHLAVAEAVRPGRTH